MSETIILAVIAFFSAVVTLMTATIGYFKIVKPMRSNGNDVDRISGILAAHISRIERLESEVDKLESEVDKLRAALDACEQARRSLQRDNHALLQELHDKGG